MGLAMAACKGTHVLSHRRGSRKKGNEIVPLQRETGGRNQSRLMGLVRSHHVVKSDWGKAQWGMHFRGVVWCGGFQRVILEGESVSSWRCLLIEREELRGVGLECICEL